MNESAVMFGAIYFCLGIMLLLLITRGLLMLWRPTKPEQYDLGLGSTLSAGPEKDDK
jgi:hypothetical protein